MRWTDGALWWMVDIVCQIKCNVCLLIYYSCGGSLWPKFSLFDVLFSLLLDQLLSTGMPIGTLLLHLGGSCLWGIGISEMLISIDTFCYILFSYMLCLLGFCVFWPSFQLWVFASLLYLPLQEFRGVFP